MEQSSAPFQRRPPSSARSNTSVHIETIVEVPGEETSPEADTPVLPPPPPVLGVGETIRMMSPLDLNSSASLTPQNGRLNSVSQNNQNNANPVIEESSEYFTANSEEAGSGNMTEPHVWDPRLQFSHHPIPGYTRDSTLAGPPLASTVPELTHSSSSDPSTGSTDDLMERLRDLDSSRSSVEEPHPPPNPRNANEYREEFNPAGSLRTRIERAQSMRYFPPESFVESMENRMIRFNPSVSTSNNEDLLSGHHPFQTQNLPGQPVNNNDIREESTIQNERRNSASRRLADQITEHNRRPVSASLFVADIPAIVRNENSPSAIQGGHTRPVESEMASIRSALESSPLSEVSGFDSTLERSRGREEEVETETAATDATLRLGNDGDFSTVSRTERIRMSQPPPQVLNTTATTTVQQQRSQELDLSTAELLRSWNRSNSTHTTTNASSHDQVVSLGNSLFGSPERKLKEAANETTRSQQNDTPQQVGGFQRSPITTTQPQTTSATQLETNEFNKLKGQEGNDKSDNWLVTLWRSIVKPFSCA